MSKTNEVDVGVMRDAMRYRWLKSRSELSLISEKQPCIWILPDGTKFSASHSLSEGGTRHSPAHDLDAMIDAAMAVSDRLDA